MWISLLASVTRCMDLRGTRELPGPRHGPSALSYAQVRNVSPQKACAARHSCPQLRRPFLSQRGVPLRDVTTIDTLVGSRDSAFSACHQLFCAPTEGTLLLRYDKGSSKENTDKHLWSEPTIQAALTLWTSYIKIRLLFPENSRFSITRYVYANNRCLFYKSCEE